MTSPNRKNQNANIYCVKFRHCVEYNADILLSIMQNYTMFVCTCQEKLEFKNYSLTTTTKP